MYNVFPSQVHLALMHGYCTPLFLHVPLTALLVHQERIFVSVLDNEVEVHACVASLNIYANESSSSEHVQGFFSGQRMESVCSAWR